MPKPQCVAEHVNDYCIYQRYPLLALEQPRDKCYFLIPLIYDLFDEVTELQDTSAPKRFSCS